MNYTNKKCKKVLRNIIDETLTGNNIKKSKMFNNINLLLLLNLICLLIFIFRGYYENLLQLF